VTKANFKHVLVFKFNFELHIPRPFLNANVKWIKHTGLVSFGHWVVALCVGYYNSLYEELQ